MSDKHRPGALALAGRCNNHLTIRRDDVEARVLGALREKLLNQEKFDEFCEDFTREMNRLRMKRRASMTCAKREVARIGARIKKLLNLMLDDERNWRLSSRRRTHRHRFLHPEMARIYRTNVTDLAAGLHEPQSRVEATDALRGPWTPSC